MFKSKHGINISLSKILLTLGNTACFNIFEMTLSERTFSVPKMYRKHNSPGIDGLIIELYKTFWYDIKDVFFICSSLEI